MPTNRGCGRLRTMFVGVMMSCVPTGHEPDDSAVESEDPGVQISPEKMDEKLGMVPIPAGTFEMGSSGEVGDAPNEKPQHEVTLTRDWVMTATEVTEAQYMAWMGTLPMTRSCDDCPMPANWDLAQALANELSLRAGLTACFICTDDPNLLLERCELNPRWATIYDCPGYRLPTEAEWERAARGTHAGSIAGSEGELFDDDHCDDDGGDSLGGGTFVGDYAWYGCNSADEVHPVGSLIPTSWGLFDMSGNERELTWDWYEDEYPDGPATDPTGPDEGEYALGDYRVVRGGNYVGNAIYVRVAARGIHSGTDGFRLVRSTP